MSSRGRTNHVIGIHVNRDNPDIINVFDANRVEVSVPRAHFEDWLNKHLDGYGEIRVRRDQANHTVSQRRNAARLVPEARRHLAMGRIPGA
jgi:hypothetical protein